MKNILLRQTIYDRIVVYTPLEDTQEYDDIDVEYLNEIPPFFHLLTNHNIILLLKNN